MKVACELSWNKANINRRRELFEQLRDFPYGRWLHVLGLRHRALFSFSILPDVRIHNFCLGLERLGKKTTWNYHQVEDQQKMWKKAVPMWWWRWVENGKGKKKNIQHFSADMRPGAVTKMVVLCMTLIHTVFSSSCRCRFFPFSLDWWTRLHITHIRG